MAQSLGSDFKLYQAEFNGGFSETLQQESQVFNGASNGAIRLVPERLRGQYDKESFFDVVSSLASRRDTTSTSTASDTAVTQDEHVGVKLNRKVGPVAIALDALKKIGREATPQEMSFILGGQVAKALQVDYLNSGLRALEPALWAQTAVRHDATDGDLATADLFDGLAKFGDAASRIVAWVGHSKQYYDLVKGQVAANIDGVSNFNIATAQPVTANRPFIMTDSDDLITTDGGGSGVDSYSLLGLTQGAVELLLSEPETMAIELVTGYENMFYRMQGEYAFNVRLKGFRWDVTNGGANPSDAALATGSNWDKAVTSDKLLAGVVIRSQ